MVITPKAIQVTLPRSWAIHNVFYFNLLEPYQTSTRRDVVDLTPALRDYDNFIAEDCTIEEIMGSSYDKREKLVMYLIQWLDYPDYEDWRDGPYEHMTRALDILGVVHKSNLDVPQDTRLRY
jgi:hypothetical protein